MRHIVGKRETTVTTTSAVADAANTGIVGDTQLLSVGIAWSKICYVTGDGRLCLCGEDNVLEQTASPMQVSFFVSVVSLINQSINTFITRHSTEACATV